MPLGRLLLIITLLSAPAFAQEIGVPVGATKKPINATACSGTDKIKSINSDGTASCDVDQGGGGAAWGSITGPLASQADLQTALNGKAASSHSHAESDIANLATDLAAKEATANKNAASGYPGLDSSSRLTTSQIIGTVTNGRCIHTNPSTGALEVATADCGSGGGTSNLLDSATHLDTTTGTVGRGDVITGQGASAAWTRLPKGAANQVLEMDPTGVDVQWGDATHLVGAGSAGTGPSNQGSATTAARSDHDHRSFATLTWYFPGVPSTGVQTLILAVPTGISTGLITGMTVSAVTTSASPSTFNIQRCTASCTGTTPTFGNIYSSNNTLSASTSNASFGITNLTQTLNAGDQFKANLVTLGSGLANLTITMTYKYATTN